MASELCICGATNSVIDGRSPLPSRFSSSSNSSTVTCRFLILAISLLLCVNSQLTAVTARRHSPLFTEDNDGHRRSSNRAAGKLLQSIAYRFISNILIAP